jgi:hypothetical protein
MSDDEDFDDTENKKPENFPFNFQMVEPEIGKVYPIYGMITEIISEKPFTILINNQIEGVCTLEDPEKIQTVKNRMLECGIFLTKIESKKDNNVFVGQIETIIFGKKQTEYDA